MLNRVVLVLLFSAIVAFANVFVKSPNTFHEGDPLVFQIEATGIDIKFPNINSIDGFVVTKNGSSNSLTIVNGKRNQTISKTYKLFPNKTVTIPPFKILIDNKEFLTKEKRVNKIKAQKTKSKFIDFKIVVSDKELYVGEQTLFTLTFKYRRDLQIVDLGFTTPTFNDFWSKQINQPKKYMDGEFVVQELQYVIFPQKSGKITIPALKVDVSLVDSRNNNMSFFGPAVRIEKIYSNELTLNIKDLPNNAFLIGDFTINETVDEKVLNAGEALNFDIQIQGRGNIDDIPDFKLDIPSATIYDNKAVKTYDMINGKYGGTYKKSYSIVANEDIIIPSFSLQYFDKVNNKIKVLKTKEHKIKVLKSVKKESELFKQNGAVKENDSKVKEIVKVIETTDNQKLLYFFFGVLSSSLLIGLSIYIFKLKAKESQIDLPLEKELRNTKSNSELLNILLSYINMDRDLDKMIYRLENEKTLNFKPIKKEILAIVRQKDIR